MAKKVLLIDDDEDVTFLLAFRLKSNGFEVVVAHVGALGIKKAIEEKPDIICCDLMIPEIDGFAIAQRLNDMEETRHIPIILLTGAMNQDIVRKTQNTNIKDCLAKPFDSIILIEKIKALTNE
ncbi:MAG: response regulator [Candidatus Margulisiibacteriota bacterium]